MGARRQRPGRAQPAPPGGRARVAVPVYIPWLDGQLVGSTLDLSEGGIRALVDGWGLPPEPGTVLQLSLSVGGRDIDLRGETVWQVDRSGSQWLIAVRFVDIPERDADALRRWVFQVLREERAARAD